MKLIALMLLWQTVVGTVPADQNVAENSPPPSVQGPIEHFDLEEPLSRNRFESPKEPVPDLNREDRFDLGEFHDDEGVVETGFQCSLRPNKKFVRCVRRR